MEKISPSDIAEVGSMVNREAGISGFRKINVLAGNFANWSPSAPQKIYYDVYSLLDNYYNVWSYGNDVYEREARFHISLMRIHPFEDGNKRTAKLIMMANFVKQNYPPVILTERDTNTYYNFINNEDIKGFADFLRNRSFEELRTLISIYKTIHNIPIIEDMEELTSKLPDIKISQEVPNQGSR